MKKSIGKVCFCKKDTSIFAFRLEKRKKMNHITDTLLITVLLLLTGDTVR